jgi:cell division transport system permease protein
LKAWRGSRVQPVASALNVIVIGIALSLPAGFYLGLSNLQMFSRQLSSDPQLSIFMTLDASAAEVTAVEQRLKSNSDISRVEFISRDQALVRLKRSASLSDVLASLDTIPCRTHSSSPHATTTPPPWRACTTRRGNGQRWSMCNWMRNGRAGSTQP